MINKEDQMDKAPRKRRVFSDEFKQHVVDLYEEGMSRQEIIQKYSLTPSAFDRWVSQFRTTGTFKETVSLSELDQEKIALRKEIQRLKMENDILKQAALILAEKNDTSSIV